jgi:hypothetical protein
LLFWGGEHRQLADDSGEFCEKAFGCESPENSATNLRRTFRQAAEKDTLAGCAPQNSGASLHSFAFIRELPFFVIPASSFLFMLTCRWVFD